MCTPRPPESPSCYNPLYPVITPLTRLSPPSSHLKGVVIPSPIVFYLTELYKCIFCYQVGLALSTKLRGGLHAEINDRNLTSTLWSLLNRAYRFHQSSQL